MLKPAYMDVFETFNPFSRGPIGCPGKGMAYAEMIVAPAMILVFFLLFLRVEGDELVSERWEGATVQFRTRVSFCVAA